MRQRRLKDEDVLQIKRRLWIGEIEECIAFTYKINQSTISRIKNGMIYRDIPWPDGTTGRLARKKHKRRYTKEQRDAMRKNAFMPMDSVVQIEADHIAELQEEENEDVMAAIQMGKVKKGKTIVRREYERLPLDACIGLYPDFEMLKIVYRQGIPLLTWLTEIIMFYAHKQNLVEGMDSMKFIAAIYAAADTTGKMDELPVLEELFGV